MQIHSNLPRKHESNGKRNELINKYYIENRLLNDNKHKRENCAFGSNVDLQTRDDTAKSVVELNEVVGVALK